MPQPIMTIDTIRQAIVAESKNDQQVFMSTDAAMIGMNMRLAGLFVAYGLLRIAEAIEQKAEVA